MPGFLDIGSNKPLLPLHAIQLGNNLNRRDSRRILVYRLGHLGDTLIALPALQAIRKTFPEASIVLLSNVQSLADLVSPSQVIPPGLVDEWLTYESNDVGGSGIDLARLWVRLRRKRFDTLVYLAPRIRGARNIRRDLLFFKSAGMRRVIGELGFQSLPSRDSEGHLPAVAHEADHLLQRLSLSGIRVPAAGDARIDLALTEDEHQHADSWLRQHAPGQPATKSLVGFGPGSKWPSKIWPEERFVELGQKLIQARNVFPIVFGGPEDRERGERLLRAWGRGANAAGALPVRHAAAALARCELYVGNDTGTMHLSAAVGTPCVAIMTALDWPGHWNPYGEGHTVLRRSVPCEGCLLRVCVKEGMRCLKEIGVAEVLEACVEKLRKQARTSDLELRIAMS